MRVIYGELDNPSSAHILIIRGIDVDSINYFKEHIKNYPTWGCILASDIKNPLFDKAMVKVLPQTPIHQIILEVPDNDEELISYVWRKFPKYDEDSDPVDAATVDTFTRYAPPLFSHRECGHPFPLVLRNRQMLSVPMLRGMGCLTSICKVEDIPTNILENLKRDMLEKLLAPEYNHLFNFEIERSFDTIIVNSSIMVSAMTKVCDSGVFEGPTP